MVIRVSVVSDTRKHVKMVSQQAIGIRFRDRLDVFEVELQEVRVVTLFDKDVFPVGATVIDVIVHAGHKRRWTGHRMIYPQTWHARPGTPDL